jgi:DNA-binding XRE family transcriptional regulator
MIGMAFQQNLTFSLQIAIVRPIASDNTNNQYMASRGHTPVTGFASVRLASGLTQSQVGLLLGISQPLVAQVENGKRPPWPKIKRDAARLFHVPEQDLFPLGSEIGAVKS